MKKLLNTDTLCLLVFGIAASFLLFCGDTKAETQQHYVYPVTTETIVDFMVESKCGMESIQMCLSYRNNSYVQSHCDLVGWQCHSWIQVQTLNVLFCEGVCAAVLHE